MNLHLLLPFFIYSDPLHRKDHERIFKVVQECIPSLRPLLSLPHNTTIQEIDEAARIFTSFIHEKISYHQFKSKLMESAPTIGKTLQPATELIMKRITALRGDYALTFLNTQVFAFPVFPSIRLILKKRNGKVAVTDEERKERFKWERNVIGRMAFNFLELPLSSQHRLQDEFSDVFTIFYKLNVDLEKVSEQYSLICNHFDCLVEEEI